MRIIDAHQHFWLKNLFRGRSLGPKWQPLIKDFQPIDLWPLMEAVGVQQTVLVQTHSSLDNSFEFLHLADEHDWIAAVVGWVDLTDPAIGEVLDKLIAYPKFKGVRHQWEDEPDPAWIMRPEVLRGLREVARRGLRYDLLAKPPNWEYLPKVAEAVPELPLVIDHIAKPRIREGQLEDWVKAMSNAAKFPQMMCKLSGMVTEADWQNWKPADLRPYVEAIIEIFGVERVMFGSDWPVCVLAASYAEVFHALEMCLTTLSESEKAQIMGENAQRFYGIV